MKLTTTSFGLFALALLAGCSNPADKVPAAAVSSATNEVAPAARPVESQGRTFAFGPDSSKIEFIGSKVTGSHNGGFKKFAGELKVVEGRVADTGNKVVIDTASLYADNDKLTGHLKSPDFFNVAQYPTATFETTSVGRKLNRLDGLNEGTNWTVSGNLTLHGVTKQISVPATIQLNSNEVSLSAVFFINRFDFGIKYAGKSDDLIRKEVVLKLSIKAIPAG